MNTLKSLALDRRDYDDFLSEIGLTHEDMRRAALSAKYATSHSAKAYIAPSALHGLGVSTRIDIEDGDSVARAMIGGMWTIFGRYANHSANPSCMMRRTHAGMWFVAIRNIRSHEEITVNYRQVKETLNEEALVENQREINNV